MTKLTVTTLSFGMAVLSLLFEACSSPPQELRTFYTVSLVCEANTEIGWGSRVKPLFFEAGKLPEIKESWMNRKGTVIAIVWQEDISAEDKERIIRPLFNRHNIQAKLVTDENQKKILTDSFFSNQAPAQKGVDKWYQGTDVDQLSMEEASSLSDSATAFALKAGLINNAELLKIKGEIEEYMRAELVKIRTYKDLTNDETDLKWKKYGYEIYVKYIGSERAEDVRDLYIEYQKKLHGQ